jgi:Flp pilus assembly CpaE family ATPase
VLAWGRGAPRSVSPAAFDSVVEGVARGGDLVVIDLGRGSPFSAEALGRADTVLVVAPSRLRAVAAGAQLLALTREGQDVRLLVRADGRGGLDPLDLSDALGLPLGGIVPRDSRREEDEEYGVAPGLTGRGGLARLCRALLRGVPSSRAA